MTTAPFPADQPAGVLITAAEFERRLAEVTAERDQARASALDLAETHVADRQEIAALREDRDQWRTQAVRLFEEREAYFLAARQAATEESALRSELIDMEVAHEREREDIIEQCARVLGASPKAATSITKQVLAVFDAQRDRIAAEQARADEWRQAYEFMERFAITDALNQTEKQTLVHRLGLEGYRLGLPVPTGVWPRFITDEERAASGIHPRTYRKIEKKFDDLGFFTVARKEPLATEERSVGHPYDVRTPNPDRIRAFLFEELPTIEVRIETQADRDEKDRRQQRKLKDDAAKARLVEEAAVGRQLIRERDSYTRERDEAREAAARAVVEAQRLVQEHQRSEALACRGCGQKIDPKDWRCNDCREREAEERQEPVAPVLLNAAGINRPKVPIVPAAFNNCTANDGADGVCPICKATPSLRGWTCKACNERIEAQARGG